jgi:hypothetical protein
MRHAKIKPILLILLAVVFLPSVGPASITEGGTGMLFGSDHAFSFTAAREWVLDNRSAVPQGLHMVFYPAGQSWSGSPVMAYGRSVPKNAELRSIRDQVDRTVKEFHLRGSPKYSAEANGNVGLPDGRTAEVYFFRGDQWGNYEAVGYIEEPTTINFLVYNARNKVEFEKHLPAFRYMLATYRNMFEDALAREETKFDSLIAEAKALENTDQGKAYGLRVIREFGNSLADIMKVCTGYTTRGEKARFDLVVRIKPDGAVSGAFIRPTNALTACVRGLVIDTKHPPHTMEPFLLYLDMRVTE